MKTDPVITCDLCGGTIKAQSHAIYIAVPLPHELRAAITRDLEDWAKRAGSPTFGPMIPIRSFVPDKWTLEACGCVLQLLPMLRQAVVDDVARNLAKKAADRAAADAPIDLEAL